MVSGRRASGCRVDGKTDVSSESAAVVWRRAGSSLSHVRGTAELMDRCVNVCVSALFVRDR